MDYAFYENLLDRMILHMFGDRAEFEEKGIFEWDKLPPFKRPFMSINIKYRFRQNSANTEAGQNKPRKFYFPLRSNIYISELSEDNTFFIYHQGGGMTKRYLFEMDDSKIRKLNEKNILIH